MAPWHYRPAFEGDDSDFEDGLNQHFTPGKKIGGGAYGLVRGLHLISSFESQLHPSMVVKTPTSDTIGNLREEYWALLKVKEIVDYYDNRTMYFMQPEGVPMQDHVMPNIYTLPEEQRKIHVVDERLVMPYLSGKILRECGDTLQRLQILHSAMLLVLYIAKRTGVLHVDLNPRNILVDVKVDQSTGFRHIEKIRIIDWGSFITPYSAILPTIKTYAGYLFFCYCRTFYKSLSMEDSLCKFFFEQKRFGEEKYINDECDIEMQVPSVSNYDEFIKFYEAIIEYNNWNIYFPVQLRENVLSMREHVKSEFESILVNDINLRNYNILSLSKQKLGDFVCGVRDSMSLWRSTGKDEKSKAFDEIWQQINPSCDIPRLYDLLCSTIKTALRVRSGDRGLETSSGKRAVVLLNNPSYLVLKQIIILFAYKRTEIFLIRYDHLQFVASKGSY